LVQLIPPIDAETSKVGAAFGAPVAIVAMVAEVGAPPVQLEPTLHRLLVLPFQVCPRAVPPRPAAKANIESKDLIFMGLID